MRQWILPTLCVCSTLLLAAEPEDDEPKSLGKIVLKGKPSTRPARFSPEQKAQIKVLRQKERDWQRRYDERRKGRSRVRKARGVKDHEDVNRTPYIDDRWTKTGEWFGVGDDLIEFRLRRGVRYRMRRYYQDEERSVMIIRGPDGSRLTGITALSDLYWHSKERHWLALDCTAEVIADGAWLVVIEQHRPKKPPKPKKPKSKPVRRYRLLR